MFKQFLIKLGKRKFMAYLLVTIVNLIILVGHLMGYMKIDQQLDPFMPVINLIVQTVATAIYQWVEGSIDREAQRQQVYVMPGSAPSPADGSSAVSPQEQAAVDAHVLPWAEIRSRVKDVNGQLNTAMDHMDGGGITAEAKAAAARYLAVHQMLSGMDPLPPAPPKGESSNGTVPGNG